MQSRRQYYWVINQQDNTHMPSKACGLHGLLGQQCPSAAAVLPAGSLQLMAAHWGSPACPLSLWRLQWLSQQLLPFSSRAHLLVSLWRSINPTAYVLLRLSKCTKDTQDHGLLMHWWLPTCQYSNHLWLKFYSLAKLFSHLYLWNEWLILIKTTCAVVIKGIYH